MLAQKMFAPKHHGTRLFPVLSFALVVMYVDQTWSFWSNKKQTQQIANLAASKVHSSPTECCQILNQMKTIAKSYGSRNNGGYNSTDRILRNGGWKAIECGLRSKNVHVIAASADISIQLTLQRATARKFAQDPVLSTLIIQALAKNAVDNSTAGGQFKCESTALLPLLQLFLQIVPYYPFGLDAERDEKLCTAISLLSQETVSRLTSRRKHRNDYALQCKTLLLHIASQSTSYLPQHTLAKQYVYDPIISHFASLLPLSGTVDPTDEMLGVFTEQEEIYLLLAFMGRLWDNSKVYTNDSLQYIFSFTRSALQFSIEHCDLLASLMLALGLGFFWGALRCAIALRTVPIPAYWSRWSWIGFMSHVHARRAGLASLLVTLHTLALDQHRTCMQSDLGQTIWLAARTGGEIAMLRLLLLFCPYFILPCFVTALVRVKT